MREAVVGVGESQFGFEIMDHINLLADCSETPEKLTRTYLTPEHRRANGLVLGWMRDAGMACRVDPVGNVIGRYEGCRVGLPALILGSHLDTVRDAGKYDGMLGVVAAIACVNALSKNGERFDFAIEVVGFGDEEGVRFQSTLLGSRALAGTLDPLLLKRRDGAGISVARALQEFGLDPQTVPEAAKRVGEVLAYVELHIEQGPVLESEKLPVGVVTSIAGATRLRVQISGQAGHAGTVPMESRKDALAAAAEAILAVEAVCRGTSGAVGTVGKIEALPGAINVIPGEANFTVDIRAGEDPPRETAVGKVMAVIEEICGRRGVVGHVENTHENRSTPCSPWLIEQIAGAIASEGIPVRRLTSGAGHDAMAMADLTDIGMLFVRCRGGISHHADESITADDANIAARVLLTFIRSFRPEIRDGS